MNTTDQYWDCECPNNYIHPNSVHRCEYCMAVQHEQPDSTTTEVIVMKLQDLIKFIQEG